MSEKRQLFIFFQFAGNNFSYCNQVCPYCYGGKQKDQQSYWNGDINKWEKAFENLDIQHGNSGIYFVMSYGESMGMQGFYECVDMIGRHPTWTLCIVSNLSFSPERLINTRLVREGRLFLHPCWHPFGMADGNRSRGWAAFKRHLLMLKKAGVPIHVLYLWWKPQISLFPEYFYWLDANNIRVNVRRYVGKIGDYKLPFFRRTFGGKTYPKAYTKAEHGFIYANTCPKVSKYGLDLVSPKGRLCTAGKDMILVKFNGEVAYCADTENTNIGNVFDPDFRLSNEPIKCPTCLCGGDYGMLHLVDDEFQANPVQLPKDAFLSIAENLQQGSPVPYPKRAEMLKWLKQIK
jgi:hypothetical protein